MKTIRRIAQGTSERVVHGVQVIDGVMEMAASATGSAVKNSILSSNTALSAYSLFQASSAKVKVGVTAIVVAGMGSNN